MTPPPIRRALISVSDKLGLAAFAQGLTAAGVELYSTGGTRAFLQAEGMVVKDVAAYTGFPEMLDGRVKTLHPKIHGGILARHDRPDDLAAIAAHGIVTFELVVVNLYPFEATVARPETTFEEAVEQIDIGGPSLIRAACKNHAFITVATDPAQYSRILEQVQSQGHTTGELRRELAQAAFERTAAYDRAIADYFAAPAEENRLLRTRLHVDLRRGQVLRYGENPHQPAAVYAAPDACADANLIAAQQLSGKELSYNNLLDLDSALTIVRSLSQPACVVIKHNNPCGAAQHESLATATRRAMEGDPLSAFGSVLGLNRVLDRATAEVLAEPGLFVEAIVAADYEPAALEILTTRPKWKSNVRLMKVGPIEPLKPGLSLRQIEGGWLAQLSDVEPDPESEWKVVTRREPLGHEWDDLRFAWALVRHVKSNAITLAAQGALLGAGAGQMSRVDSVEIALKKAGPRAKGAALASDAFFPFPDSIEQATAAGVTAIIQPGGSKRDDEVIAECDRHGLAMVFTGRRHFKH
ncbi:MAG TPA: bifunctional phosphoribosylaminoimidazolecarboxamide formyltransferase/IMP cyclohydrolase [Pirellulales bacterium]|jgi:phosphoribosylaminoimidazolecarboxamide formyltransferase/IMP cyclohydrolase|nr:bifunctional phosphoribosylaminoimidazolecarboxamide formyltransferase/IMP cyclohydrolase [Pirellulales bacterium]